MSLFEVPGWSVPSAPVSQAGKKRKRPSVKDSSDDIDEAQRIQSAQKNIEKLMRSLGEGKGALDGGDSSGGPTPKKREGKNNKGKGADGRAKGSEPERGRKLDKKHPKDDSKRSPSKQQKPGSPSPKSRERSDAPPTKGKKKQRQRQKSAEPVEAHSETESIHGDKHPPSSSQPAKATKSPGKAKGKDQQPGLTTLQANMKKSLDGARFRWINETLYKSDSAEAHKLMSKDPAVFADYHTGFRHQVESWPTNPVSHYISSLSSYPPKTVIADLGCGDAALARALLPKGLTILSFDLVSDNMYVVEADTCAHVPLPGSEPSPDSGSSEGEGQVVDVVVCALSLMGTNWPGCIREAWRILRSGGELRIAEVTSRFTSVEEFVTFISSFGFKLKSKDERNTHFTLFDFKKVPRKPKGEKDWEKLSSRGSILKPCEYKRR